MYGTFVLQGITGTILGVLLWFFAPEIARSYFQTSDATNTLRIFCVYFFAVNFLSLIGNILFAFQDIFTYKLIDTLRLFMIGLFVVYTWLMGKSGLEYYGFAWIFGVYGCTFVGIWLLLKKYRHLLSEGKIIWEKTEAKRYIKYALW